MNNEPTPKKLWRRILRKVGFAAIILIVLGITFFFVWYELINHQIKAEIQKIRAAGQPVSFEEWEAKLPKIDEAQNAVRFYKAAADLLLPRKDSYDPWVERSKYFTAQTPQMQKEVEPILAANRLSLELLDKGCTLPGCRDELWVETANGKIIKKLNLLRQVMRLNSLRTVYLASRDKGDEAVNSAISSLRFIRIFNGQPLFITYLDKHACQSRAYYDIGLVLQSGKPSQRALENLQKTLLDGENPNDFEKMLLGERVYGIEMMKDTFPGNCGPSSMLYLIDRWSVMLGYSPFIMRTYLGYLKDMTKVHDISSKPWPEIFNEMNQYHAENWLGKDLLQVCQGCIVHTGQGLAEERSTLVAIAIERYRRTHNGNLPEKLSDLVPTYMKALPVDPFTGKDILYLRDQSSYTIYSVGDDLKDGRGNVLSVILTRTSPNGGRSQDWGIKIDLRHTH